MNTDRRNRGTLRRLPLVFAIAAVAALGASSAASAQPVISITGGPGEGSFTNQRKVTFDLAATAPSTKQVDFFCSFDNPAVFYGCHPIDYPACVPAGGTQSCTQSITRTLSEGQHTFYTFAADCDAGCEPADVGIEGPTIARTFTIDLTAPIGTIANGPTLEAPALRSAPSFNLTSNEPGTFSCSLDGGPALLCESIVTFPDLFRGTHALTVNAVDRAGNSSAPVTRSFKVDRFKAKKCKRGRSARAKAKYRKCKRANAVAKAKWKKRNKLR